jgi:hypothetical protein
MCAKESSVMKCTMQVLGTTVLLAPPLPKGCHSLALRAGVWVAVWNNCFARTGRGQYQTWSTCCAVDKARGRDKERNVFRNFYKRHLLGD